MRTYLLRAHCVYSICFVALCSARPFSKEMSATRLGRLSEGEEASETDGEENAKPSHTPTSTRERNGSARSLGQLHVTINAKPEELHPSDSFHSKSDNGSSSRRPSILVQEILSSRRPSAIMQALKSPKQLVNRYRRE